jgi:hypothetical protein
MRRRFRGISLIVFLAGLVIYLVGATGMRFSREINESRPGANASESHGTCALGLAIQAIGVTGYLAIATFWPRRSR